MAFGGFKLYTPSVLIHLSKLFCFVGVMFCRLKSYTLSALIHLAHESLIQGRLYVSLGLTNVVL